MPYYAQKDDSGKVFAVSQLAREVEAENLIEIDSYDENKLGKYHDPETGLFQDELSSEIKEIAPEKPTLLTKIKTLLGK